MPAQEVILDRFRLIREVNPSKLLLHSDEGTAHFALKVNSQLKGRSIAFNQDGQYEPLKHAHLIQCIDVFERNGETFILLEHASHGTLKDRIREAQAFRKPLSEAQVLQLFLPVASALQHMHASKRVHGQPLSVGCLFVTPNTMKLAMINGTNDAVRVAHKGPPELSREAEDVESGDIWFLGCILYELCTFEMVPVNGAPGPLPAMYSSNLQRLCEELLRNDPDERPSLSEVMKLKWVHDACQKLGVTARPAVVKKASPRKAQPRVSVPLTPTVQCARQKPPVSKQPSTPIRIAPDVHFYVPTPETPVPEPARSSPMRSYSDLNDGPSGDPPVVNCAKWMAEKMNQAST